MGDKKTPIGLVTSVVVLTFSVFLTLKKGGTGMGRKEGGKGMGRWREGCCNREKSWCCNGENFVGEEKFPVDTGRCTGSHGMGFSPSNGRWKIIHYRQVYLNRQDPIAFMPVAVDTSGRIYDDFSRLLFLHAHREASALANELPEESGQFRFLHTACLANLQGSVVLILVKASAMRISIPLNLSSRPFIPLARWIRSRRPTPLLAPSLVFFPPCSA